MSPDPGSAAVRALVDEWVRSGVTDAVVAPGSRSTPLALALAGEPRVRVHVLLDERSAAGFALGLGQATGRPAVLCCTSGTAGAHFHGAVLEAHHGRVPLVVGTADRPPELHDVGAGQTVAQHHLFGEAVRWFHDPGVPFDGPEVLATWRHLGARSVASALGPPAGPVHLNLPFREPLVPAEGSADPAHARVGAAPSVPSHVGSRLPTDAQVDAFVDAVRATPRGVLAAGWGAGVSPAVAGAFLAATGWVLFADPLSNLRTTLPGGGVVVSTYDALLRDADVVRSLAPEATVRIGAPLTGAAARRALDTASTTWLIDPDDRWLDPSRAATGRFVCDADALLRMAAERLEPSTRVSEWSRRWAEVERAGRAALDAHCDTESALFEGRIARDVVAAAPAGAALVVASSMPVRDVESFAAPREGVRLFANRGVNGIDGVVSTVLGVGAGWAGPTVGLLGDLCFLHDSNGLLGARARALDVTLVVVDNDGGGIFSFLPQASSPAVPADDFERLFGTPHGLDLRALAAVHGIPCTEVTEPGDVGPAVSTSVDAGGVRMVLARTDRATNVARHDAAWRATAEAVAPLVSSG
ncbi:MAG TPA: 2-succinyl-5-enolpyruvyl-6-hydroxy-3-cyclohexene-1-carboxylic-acid synthase [Acidimicrobiia bacterium]|nr:2-succinyl-5-enolpyruvyl-6-hydroxy-3-cyclohexene-1-carboxylic-acid synthase [Acidimicrobiia bacterium]